MIKINIKNETAKLRSVIVGIADNFVDNPTIDECYDPKSKEHVLAGTFPASEICKREMDGFVSILKKYNVEVYRPEDIQGLNQIFARDIAFGIEDILVLPNIIEDRKKEIDGVTSVLNQIENTNKIKMPKGARAEGGDVIVWNEYIFVGYSEREDFERYTVSRTNRAGLDFLSKVFLNKRVKGLELNKSDDNPRDNALHLDCCFQPIGKNMAILYKGGFKNLSDFNFLKDYFGKDNIIEVTKEEMYNMNSNIFSISEKVIISEKGFLRLNKELRRRGFIVEEISYSEIAKMSGLLRCSTMPLIRK